MALTYHPQNLPQWAFDTRTPATYTPTTGEPVRGVLEVSRDKRNVLRISPRKRIEQDDMTTRSVVAVSPDREVQFR